MKETGGNHCTILILTFHGELHLKYLLPSIATSINQCKEYKFEVVVVDNANKNKTKHYVENNFQNIQYYPSPVNNYLFSLNLVVKRISSPLVFILNDDMKMHKDTLKHLLPIMIKDSKIFSINCKVLNWDGKGQQSNVRLIEYIENAWYSTFWSDKEISRTSFTLYGGGGSAIFRTSIFNEFGGFNKLFSPAYCEDLDLGHRSWQKGYINIYHPEAILYHRDGATLKEQFEAKNLSVLIYKNRILEMVKNGKQSGFLFKFLLMLPYRLLFGWRVNLLHWKALWKALPKMSAALYKRFEEPVIISEKEIIETLGKTYLYRGN